MKYDFFICIFELLKIFPSKEIIQNIVLFLNFIISYFHIKISESIRREKLMSKPILYMST